ncbi:MAG TPA: HAD hydrolase-like protein, partial [Dehalococcoidia bacterium]|nr:HAD hydrolase-like protein [Dehalococcoidia bacterium]
MQRMRAIVFDLDGTLVDTFALCLQSTQHVLRRFISRPVPDAEVIPLYGIPLRDIMARLADLPTGQAGGQTR